MGDDLRLDVQGAQQAGLRAVWLKRDATGADSGQVSGQDSGQDSGQNIVPDAICRDLGELLDWLKREHG